MAGLSQNITTKLVDLVTSKAGYSLPTAYLALLTGAGASGSSILSTMNEVTTGAYPNYVRIAVPGSSLAAASISGGGAASNSSAVIFAVCGAGGTAPVVTSWALVDAASGTVGNILWYGTFATSMTVNTGNQPAIPAGNLTFTLTTSSGYSNFLVTRLIDHSDGKTAYAPPTALYAALVTGTPSASQVAAATDIVEPTSGQYAGYARVQIPAATWAAAALSGGTATTNNANATITFPTSTGGTGANITGFALITNTSTTPGAAGDILFWASLTSQIISSGTTPYFNLGGLTINIV